MTKIKNIILSNDEKNNIISILINDIKTPCIITKNEAKIMPSSYNDIYKLEKILNNATFHFFAKYESYKLVYSIDSNLYLLELFSDYSEKFVIINDFNIKSNKDSFFKRHVNFILNRMITNN